MKKNQSEDDSPLHQSVAEAFEFKSAGKSIAVEFTDQKLSAHAGSAVFWAWLHGARWRTELAEHLPHRASVSNNHLSAVDKALAFTHGLICEARKLTHVAYFRRDPMVPELLGIRRVASQSSLSRFFAGFTSGVYARKLESKKRQRFRSKFVSTPQISPFSNRIATSSSGLLA